MGNTSKGSGFEEAKAAFAKTNEEDKNEQPKDEFEDWAVLKRCRGHRGSKSRTFYTGILQLIYHSLFVFQLFLTSHGAQITYISQAVAQTRLFVFGMSMNMVSANLTLASSLT